MSGIAGYLSKTPFKSGEIIRINQAIGHRGTEEEGFAVYQNNDFKLLSGLHSSIAARKIYPLIQPDVSVNLAVGFRGKNTQYRDSNSFQPVSKQNVLLVFDGVIYNIKEIKTALGGGSEITPGFSPAELLLTAYHILGLDFIHRLKGQFAITIIDKVMGKIHLIRDQVGIKPLFYYLDGKRFVWSSEIKGILALDVVSRKICTNGLLLNYQFKTTLPPLTCFENIFSVLPGNIFSIELENFEHTTRSYWEIPVSSRKESMGIQEALSTLENKLSWIIEQQSISDFGVTSMMSGGIDSGVITSIYARKYRDPSCYTLSIDGSGEGLDEVPQAKGTASAIGIRHMIQELAEAEIVENTSSWLQWFEEPYTGPDVTFPAMRFLRENGFSVTLTGNGGDEVFGGYAYVLKLKKWRALQHFSGALKLLQNSHRQLKKAQYYASLKTTGQFFLSTTSGLRDYDLAKLIRNLELKDIRDLTNRFLQTEQFGSDYDGIFYCDLKYSISAHHVYHDDICAQRFGMEIRYPYLDTELIEWVAGLPVSLRYNGKKEKPLLRKFAAKYLPKENLQMPKKGFRIPQDRILASNETMRRFYKQQIDFLKDYGLFVPEEIDRICRNGETTENYNYVWQLISTAVWLKTYF